MSKKKSIVLFLSMFTVFYIVAGFTLVDVTDNASHQETGHPYNKKDTSLINNLNKLKYDSVKVFSINCERIDRFFTPPSKMDSANFYYIKKAGDPYYHEGINIGRKTADTLVNLFKYAYKDIYRGNPVGPYIPTIGFAFFKQGVTCAHVELAFSCNKIEIEIFKGPNRKCSYGWIVLGKRMIDFLKPINKKYYQPPCVEIWHRPQQ